MKIMHSLIVILFSLVWPIVAMDIEQSSWKPLSLDLVKKIAACTDSRWRKSLFCSCSEFSQIKTQDLLLYSPLILTHHEHIFHMVQTAKEGKTEIMKNLIYNAANGDHADCLDWMYIFYSDVNSYEYAVGKEMFARGWQWTDTECRYKKGPLSDMIVQCRKRYVDWVETKSSDICFVYKGDEHMKPYIEKMYPGFNYDLGEQPGNTPLLRAIVGGKVFMAELLIAQRPD